MAQRRPGSLAVGRSPRGQGLAGRARLPDQMPGRGSHILFTIVDSADPKLKRCGASYCF
jgi:hypothetical protein